MPNIKSAKKRVKIAEAKNLRNRMFKTQMKTIIKKYNACVEAGDKAAAEAAYKAAVIPAGPAPIISVSYISFSFCCNYLDSNSNSIILQLSCSKNKQNSNDCKGKDWNCHNIN